jgi:MYXO-CTERM domain-containing protein
VSYATYEGLHLRYGAAHGIGGSGSHHVTVRGCDISFIGGGLLDPTVRFGNGIEFWEEAHDNLVEGNRIWEIYDAALTNQGSGQSSQYNLVYRNNVVWNAEYCFECWQRPEGSVIHDITFENNTCVRSGYGWGHEQRPDPNGWHLIFWGMEAPPERFFVRNNVFYEAKLCAFNPWDADWSWLDGSELDYNLYFQSEGYVMCAPGQTSYGQADFGTYQADTGRDLHSLAADPLFVDTAGADFHLQAGSPAIVQGIDNGVSVDIEGTARPQGAGWDMGAYEYHAAEPPDAGSGGEQDGGLGGGGTGGGGTGGDAGAAVASDASESSSGCGCSAAGGRSGVLSMVALLALGVLRRSRSRQRL